MSVTSTPDTGLDEDLLAEVADCRARGLSWEATAAQLQWDAPDLRRAIRHSPGFDAAYEYARQELIREAEAELLFTLRKGMRNPDVLESCKAAECLARHLAGQRRDETRLEV